MKWEKTADHHHDQSTIIILIAVDRHRQICQNHCLIIIIWKQKGERERENAVMITEWADPHGHSHLPSLFSLLFSRAPHCQRQRKRERERESSSLCSLLFGRLSHFLAHCWRKSSGNSRRLRRLLLLNYNGLNGRTTTTTTTKRESEDIRRRHTAI